MLLLYQNTNMSLNEPLLGALRPVETKKYETVKYNIFKLLEQREATSALASLKAVPFWLYENEIIDWLSTETISFQLHAMVKIELYERMRVKEDNEQFKRAFEGIAQAFADLKYPLRYITVEIALEKPPKMQDLTISQPGLSDFEIEKLVYNYIGVSQGYLADFNRQSLKTFYLDNNLDIDPYAYEGTTRERFIQILKEQTPVRQAQILQGILKLSPESSTEKRTTVFLNEIKHWIQRLQGEDITLDASEITYTSEAVVNALKDAHVLLEKTGPSNCIDRIHTVLCGYLKEICKANAIQPKDEKSLEGIYGALSHVHPAFIDNPLLKGWGGIIKALNNYRNSQSLAHPNENLLGPAEAMLMLNTTKTLLRYIEDKLNA